MWDFSHALQFTKTKGEYQAEHLSYYNALCAVFPYWRIAYRIHVAAPPDRTRYVENSLVVTGKDMKRTLRENPRKAEIDEILEIKRLSHGTWKRPMCGPWN